MTREELINHIEYNLEINADVFLTDEDARMVIKALEKEPCEDEYIKVPKKALKYRTAGMVAYNAEWLKNHFDIERAVICGTQEPCDVFDEYGNYKYPNDIELTEPNTATSMPCEDIISREDVVDILLNEMECVQRASDDECDRDCIKCDLLRDTDKILQAYRMAIKDLEHPEKNVVVIVPCSDCISREDALMALTGEWTELTDEIIHRFIKRIKALPPVTPQQKYEDIAKAFQFGLAFGFGKRYDEMDRVIDEIKKVVTPQPKTGHWISFGVQGEVDGQIVQTFTCSECGAISIFRLASGNIVNGDLCPNCGRCMVKPQEREE